MQSDERGRKGTALSAGRNKSVPPVRPTPDVAAAIQLLPQALKTEQQPRVRAISQKIVDHVCSELNIRSIRVTVHGVRPSDEDGELHGLYTQYDGGSGQDSVKVWMRTAKLKNPVAFRTFLRTLLHELCHHLDYVYLRLGESHHTDAFFRRESKLFHSLTDKPTPSRRKEAPSLSKMVAEILRRRSRGAQNEQNDSTKAL